MNLSKSVENPSWSPKNLTNVEVITCLIKKSLRKTKYNNLAFKAIEETPRTILETQHAFISSRETNNSFDLNVPSTENNPKEFHNSDEEFLKRIELQNINSKPSLFSGFIEPFQLNFEKTPTKNRLKGNAQLIFLKCLIFASFHIGSFVLTLLTFYEFCTSHCLTKIDKMVVFSIILYLVLKVVHYSVVQLDLCNKSFLGKNNNFLGGVLLGISIAPIVSLVNSLDFQTCETKVIIFPPVIINTVSDLFTILTGLFFLLFFLINIKFSDLTYRNISSNFLKKGINLVIIIELIFASLLILSQILYIRLDFLVEMFVNFWLVIELIISKKGSKNVKS